MIGPFASLTILLASSTLQSGFFEDPTGFHESWIDVTGSEALGPPVGPKLTRTRRKSNIMTHKHLRYIKREGCWISGSDLNDVHEGGYMYNPDTSEREYISIIRVWVGNQVIPGQYRQATGECYYAISGKSYPCGKNKVEFLQTDYYYWDDRRNGDISEGAVIGGISSDHQMLFICRFWRPGTVYGTPNGVLVPSTGICTVPWTNGEAITRANYSVLKDKTMIN